MFRGALRIKMSDAEGMPQVSIRAVTILFHNMAGISRKTSEPPETEGFSFNKSTQ